LVYNICKVPYTNGEKKNGWKEVFDALRSQIVSGELAPNVKLPSEAELVVTFGVSKMTINKAIRELASEGLVVPKERVGTFVASLAANAKKTGSLRIGLILPAQDGFLEMKYLSGIREAIGPESQLILLGTDNDAVVEAEVLRQTSPDLDGILILPSCHPRISETLLRINEAGCPVVCLDRVPVHSKLAGVTSDNYGAAYRGLEYLEQTGHRRIAYFGFFSDEMSSVADRYRAYVDFISARGWTNPEDTTRFIEPRSSGLLPMELQLFRDAMARMSTLREPVTAAFCANEHYLSVLLEVCDGWTEARRKQFEIVAFCDWPSLSQPNVRTHLIRQDARGIGRAAAVLINRALETGTAPSDRQEVPASFEIGSDRSRLAYPLDEESALDGN